LTKHQELSGKKMQYYDPEREVSYVPYVVETSIGCDRMFLALMSRCLTDELVPDADGKESERTVLKLPPALAPVKCAVLPLLKNREELVEKATRVFEELKYHFPVQ